MSENGNTTEALVEVISTDAPPASGAEVQKPIPIEGEAPPETVAETTEQQEAKRQSKFQRRLDRQKAGRVAAETESRLLREQLAKLEAQIAPPQEAGEPKREAFEDFEKYLEARADWRAEQKTKSILEADRKANQGREQQGRATAEQERAAKGWTEREATFQKATKDYIDVVTPYVEEDLGHLSDAARRAIVESESGPQVLYHLAQNPDVADAIAELSPRDQAAEIGKLKVKLAAPPGKTISSAPPPAKTTPGGKSADHGLSERDSQEDYERKRREQKARWAR